MGRECSVENLAFVAELVRIRFDGLPNSHEFGYEGLRRAKVFYRAGREYFRILYIRKESRPILLVEIAVSVDLEQTYARAAADAYLT
jgi:hypothetical protein